MDCRIDEEALTAMIAYRISHPGRSFAAVFGAGFLGAGESNFYAGSSGPWHWSATKNKPTELFLLPASICLNAEQFWSLAVGIGRHVEGQDHYVFSLQELRR